MGPIERSQEWFEIADLRVPTNIGVTEQERASPQTVAFNLRFQILSAFHDLQDEIGRTVDYSEVAKAVRNAAEETQAHLIETLASEVADRLIARFPLARVEVELRKFVVPYTAYVSVRTVRTRFANSR
jgi:7,8-dihydroneopterin aldolase/epimerase/oxygenase